MKTIKLKNITIIAIFATIFCISSYIQLPLIIPITLQTFAIALCLELLGTKNTLIAYSVYFLLGAFGLPVFSGFNGGISALFNTSGGFILGFFLFIIVKGLTAKLFKNKLLSSVISSAIGLLALYIFGSVWFCFIYYNTFNFTIYCSSLLVAVVPFILPDVAKVLVAHFIAKRIKKFI